MAQQKNTNKSSRSENEKPQKKTPDDPKTFGNEPPMEEPQTPEHPDQYEVTGEQQPHQEAKPTLH